MKISNEQLNQEINGELVPYLMELSLPLPIIMKCVKIFVNERRNDYEWENIDRAMDIVRDKIDDFYEKIKYPTFEQRFGPICLN